MGGGSIVLNKKRSQIEIVNDLDPTLYVIYKAFSEYENNNFLKTLSVVQYTEHDFNLAKTASRDNPIAQLIIRRFSRGGLGKDFAWSERLRGGEPGDRHAWRTFQNIEALKIARRLQGVQVYNEDMIKIIQQFDNFNTLFYIDPPYLLSTRTSKKCYNLELSETQHIQLAHILNHVKGKVLLSGYPSELYNKLYKDWHTSTETIVNHSGQNKKKSIRTEVLWRNY